MIKTEGLKKVYASGRTTMTALDSVDISIDSGTCALLMGASGSGKTTLLDIIGCLTLPTQKLFGGKNHE